MEHRFQWPHMTEIANCKKNSLEKSLSEKQQPTISRKKKQKQVGRISFPELPHYNIQNIQF